MNVHCRLCGHEWTLVLTIGRVTSFAAFLEALGIYADAGCPSCQASARDVLIGSKVVHNEKGRDVSASAARR